MVVSELEGRADLPGDLDHHRPWKRLSTRQQFLDRPTAYQLHHVVELAVFHTASVIGDDIGVPQTLQDRHLTLKSRSNQRVLADSRVELLDGDQFLRCEVGRDVDRSDRANAQHVPEFVIG